MGIWRTGQKWGCEPNQEEGVGECVPMTIILIVKKLMYTMGVWLNKPSNGDSELNNQYYYP